MKYENGRLYVRRSSPSGSSVVSDDKLPTGEPELETYMDQQVGKGCELVHYNVLVDHSDHLIYDFLWKSPGKTS